MRHQVPELHKLGYPMNDSRRNQRLQTEDDVLAYFAAHDLDDGIRQYLRFHAKRYSFLLGKVGSQP
jgi:hypothetical protein